MVGAIFLFELLQRVRRISTYVYFVVFFALAFLFVSLLGGAFKEASVSFGGGEKVFVNAPYTLAALIGALSYFGLPVTAAIMGRAIQQDFEYQVYPFYFTTPITKLQYLTGRFLAALCVLLLVFSSIPAGALFATPMPWLDASRVGPIRLLAYVQPFFLLVIPNLLVTGAVFFMMAALLRRILPVFLTAVIAVLGYIIGASLTRELEHKTLASVIDPFGQLALSRLTEYWTVAERNARLLPFEGVLVANRALWLVVAALVFAIGCYRFAFSQVAESGRSRVKIEPSPPPVAETPLGLATASRSFSGRSLLRTLLDTAALQFAETVKNVYFAVIVLAAILTMVVFAITTNRLYGTATYPVTYIILGTVGASFFLFLYIIIIFYSGELVWRERDNGVSQIIDASPVPTWLMASSKILSLILVQALLCSVLMICGMTLQAVRSYFNFEPMLYLKQLFAIDFVRLSYISILAIMVHVLVNQKYMGHFVMIIYYLVSAFGLRFMGLQHHLYNFPTYPPVTYSDMNGYGHFVAPLASFDLYWGACALLMAVVSNLFWVRGMEESARLRSRIARARFTMPLRVTVGVAAAVLVIAGAFIFYNTNRLNHYRTTFERAELQAEYEKQYKRYKQKAQVRVTDVRVAADIFPYQRRVLLRGTYGLENKSEVPVSSVEVNIFIEAVVNKLELSKQNKRVIDDKRVGFYVLELAEPLQPHQTAQLDFDLAYHHRGFVNGEANTDVVYNGTFFNSILLPSLGYLEYRELSLDDERKKHGLAPKERMRDLNDPEGRQNNYISSDADWVTFNTTVSTSADQIALAPGYLQREWLEGGRRYFQYAMESKILKFFSFLSARYEVKRDHWNDIAIEVFYHRGHEYDLDRMINSVKKSLAYYTRNFSPYQHRQVRIVEFPRYHVFAQSFPNTIPYSEGIGFIARVNDKDESDIDYPFYVTAHEVAHQWWAHQVIGARVQGSTLLSETLAQYSALMVMKAEFGPEKMRRFLKYELDRYLVGRTTERKKELPLLRVEDQDYVHYRKGSLVMYALQDYIGEEAVNQALARYIKAVAFRGPPYTTAAELLDCLREVTPDQFKYVLEDMFENITLYENRAVKAVYKEMQDGRFDVHLTTSAKKLRADALGKEQEIGLNDWIDIGVLDEKGNVLYLQKQKIDRPQMEFSMVVDRRPSKAGIDPFNKLIDRKPDDNSIKVEKE